MDTPIQKQQPQQQPQPNQYIPDQVDESPVLKTVEIGTGFIQIISKIAFYKTINFLNYFLETLQNEISSFAPSDKDVQSSQSYNETLLKTIEQISQSPEFQKKWVEFSNTIASLLKILLQKVADATENDLQFILDKFTDMIEKNTKNAIYGAGNAALDGVCSLPPLIPFCTMANIAGTVSKVGGTTLITMLETTNKMALVFSKVFGDTAQPIINTIENVQNFINYIQNTKNLIENKIQNVSNTINQNIQQISNAQNINPYEKITKSQTQIGGSNNDTNIKPINNPVIKPLFENIYFNKTTKLRKSKSKSKSTKKYTRKNYKSKSRKSK